jgi:hypothetical protein
MWQADTEAISISSGSTPAGSECCGTTLGEEDPRTAAPPSKRMSWARL